VGQGLTDAGINPYFLGQVMMVQRTYPIRVGHVYAPGPTITPEGPKLIKVGDSGPFYPDSRELEWTDLPGVTPEMTTVTKRQRRIATWSKMQYREALRLNRPNIVLTTFMNYLPDEREFYHLRLAMLDVQKEENISVQPYWSWGPKAEQHSDRVDETMARCGWV
jgi:adenylosuccinate synthase